MPIEMTVPLILDILVKFRDIGDVAAVDGDLSFADLLAFIGDVLKETVGCGQSLRGPNIREMDFHVRCRRLQ